MGPAQAAVLRQYEQLHGATLYPDLRAALRAGADALDRLPAMQERIELLNRAHQHAMDMARDALDRLDGLDARAQQQERGEGSPNG